MHLLPCSLATDRDAARIAVNSTLHTMTTIVRYTQSVADLCVELRQDAGFAAYMITIAVSTSSATADVMMGQVKAAVLMAVLVGR